MAISRRSGTSLVELLVVMGIFSLLISLLFPAVQSTREAARRHHCQNNLRQVALANLAYESAHNSFPPGTINQRPIRTWGTTAILPPYLESVAFTADDLQGNCEERIRNDDRVRTMSQQPIPQYGCPSDPRANRVGSFIYGLPQVGPQLPLVSYVGVAGDHLPGSFTGDAGGMFFSRSAIRTGQITDGTSHTLLFGEREIRYEGSGDGTWFTFALCYCNGQTHFQFQSADHRLNSDFVQWAFSSTHPGGVHFAFVDGHVAFLSDNSDVDVLKALATRRGNEPWRESALLTIIASADLAIF